MDQALGLTIARGGEIDMQGVVEIVLHVAHRERWTFGDRLGEREGLLLQFVVGDHAVDQADRSQLLGVDPLGR